MKRESSAVSAVSADTIASEVGRLVKIPSLTGTEEDAVMHVHRLAGEWGLESTVHEFPLDVLRSADGYPGEVAPRSRLVGAEITVPGRDSGGKRLCVNGHVDVVPASGDDWQLSPWSGSLRGGLVHGRGAVDMKGGLIAALHAMAVALETGWRPEADIVFHVVSSEEDGGLGSFAALSQDADFAGAIIPEPTGMKVVCAHAGSLHFKGRLRGRAAHAALRLEGSSAIDRYIPVHAAIRAHEVEVNSEVRHPLLSRLPLPCPVEVGQLQAGNWTAEVPDLLSFAGRLGYPLGVTEGEARSRFESRLHEASDESGPLLELEWPAGFAPGETSSSAPLVQLTGECLAAERGTEPEDPEGVPWGADMNQYTARHIPTVMLGPTGIERAHAANEAVGVAELAELSRVFVRIFMRFSTLSAK